jgi:hypothetical protein
MKKDVKRFLFFIVKAFVVVLAVDFLLGAGLEVLHGHMKGGERARAHYAIRQSQSDAYIFGSSRALYHYNPQILEDSLHLTFYNAGRPAQTVLYHLPVLKMILKRHKPKMVILDINENEFVKEARKYDLLNSLLPYYRDDESVREMVDLVKPGYRYFSWSHTLPYNSSLFAITYRFLTAAGERKDVNGYIGMKGHKTMKMDTLHNCHAQYEFDPVIIDALHRFVGLCEKENIRLLVIISPRFLKTDCPREDLRRVCEELKQLQVDYLDFSGDSKYVDHLEYMYDEPHLNYEGSVEFTKGIASYVHSREGKVTDIVSVITD